MPRPSPFLIRELAVYNILKRLKIPVAKVDLGSKWLALGVIRQRVVDGPTLRSAYQRRDDALNHPLVVKIRELDSSVLEWILENNLPIVYNSPKAGTPLYQITPHGIDCVEGNNIHLEAPNSPMLIDW